MQMCGSATPCCCCGVVAVFVLCVRTVVAGAVVANINPGKGTGGRGLLSFLRVHRMVIGTRHGPACQLASEHASTQTCGLLMIVTTLVQLSAFIVCGVGVDLTVLQLQPRMVRRAILGCAPIDTALLLSHF